MDTLSWNEFLMEAQEFCQIAERLGDVWSLQKKNDQEHNAYLVYKQKISNRIEETETQQNEVLNETPQNLDDKDVALPQTDFIFDEASKETNNCDYSLDMLEIEYHIAYSVSYQVPMLYFRIYHSDGRLLNLDEVWNLFRSKHLKHADMLSILTQMDHPVLFKPFLALHPCRTAELLAQAGKSHNRIVTFLSVMGPYVELQLDNQYGLEFKIDNEELKE